MIHKNDSNMAFRFEGLVMNSFVMWISMVILGDTRTKITLCSSWKNLLQNMQNVP